MVSKKLIINAVIMYGRMLILMFMNLYISRLALDYLGVEQYGLMSVLSGVVIIGAFIATVLETTAQRYISESLTKVSTYSVVVAIQNIAYVYLVVIFGSILIVEILGCMYVNTYLNQNVLSSSELNIIFQMSVVIFFTSSINSLLLAVLIAFENIKIYSIVTLFEVFIKFILLKILINFDNNIMYYMMVLFLSILMSRVYAYLYIKKKYTNIIFIPKRNDVLLKKIYNFVRWNLIGGFSSILILQGLNIIINVYQTLAVNAARAIATQLNLAILQVVNSIQLAFNPQIVKLYTSGDAEGINKTFILNAKLTAILCVLIIVAINSNLTYFLKLWLGDYPSILVGFIYYMLIEMYFSSYTGPLLSLVQASEKIKSYQIAVGSVMFLTVPLSYIALSLYNNPLIIYYISIFINIICFLLRVYFVNKLKVVNVKYYILHVFSRVTISLIIIIFTQNIFSNIWLENYLFLQMPIILFTMLFIGLTSKERKEIFTLSKIVINKLYKR